MFVQRLDVSDFARLEAALEAMQEGTTVVVGTSAGDLLPLLRVPGGWYLEGDAVITSGDVVDGQPDWVGVLVEGEDSFDEEDYR